MIQVLKTRFCGPLSFLTHNLVSKSHRIEPPFSANLVAMAPKRRISCSATSKRSEVLSLGSSPPGKVTNEESCEIGFEVNVGDIEGVERMTVQQLRLNLRKAGISTRGCKSELVSALKSFLNDAHHVEDKVSHEENLSDTAQNSSRRNSNKVSTNDAQRANLASEVPPVKRAKKAAKQGHQEGEPSDIKQDQQLLVEPNVVGGKEKVKNKREVILDSANPSVQHNEPWTIFAHKKPKDGWIAYNPKTMRPPPLSGTNNALKLMSWNVNGLRGLLKLESFCINQLAQREDFDVLCLQETKLQEKDVQLIKERLVDGYENSFWTCSVSKLGYSGTAIISRLKPQSVKYGMGITDHDSEGRLVTVEFDSFYLLCAYVPNSGDGLRRLSYRFAEWDPSLSNYMKELEKSKPVILCGDLNCAHEEIDIFNPAGNKRSAGFTDEERQSFEKNFLNRGFVDTFRKQHPGVVGYTYWGYRHGGRKTNKGWRLDYFLASESIADRVYDSYIVPDIMGSDHCPIGLVLKL
ncbi:unnamed protein product [Cuscuta campestris]|uniref:DNA-(apurinic or apyrimidinic site) endonuclease n=1 Tax=Cuscuta campestris TaxID=132261 RepID=A0A484KPA9_9ASTE|nr:unnamed protein product [Cuscuta campestris]